MLLPNQTEATGRVAAAQQAHDDPGDGQAADEDRQLGNGARAAQPDHELVELAVVEGMDHGPAPDRNEPGPASPLQQRTKRASGHRHAISTRRCAATLRARAPRL